MTPLTWNADSQRLGGGAALTRVHGKWHNYLGVAGWDRIDLSIAEAGGLFSVSKAPYSLDVPALANDWSVIQSTNKYDIWQKRTMPDGPVGIQKRYPTAVPVAGVATLGGILFSGAFPSLNADRLVQLHEQEVRDLIVFASEPPGAGDVVVPIEISPEGLPALKSVGRGVPAQEADFRTDVDIEHGLSFTTGSFRGVKINAPRVWDSAGRSAPIFLRMRQDGSRLVGHKVIPRSFLSAASYPVFADTTSTFYPDPNPETTTVDGMAQRIGAGTWASVRGGAGTTGFPSDTATSTALLTNGSNWEQFNRAILLFDTSALPDGDAILSATLNLRGFTKEDPFSAAIVTVASNPASDIDIVEGDYETMGTTALSSTLSIASYSIAGYNSLTLNAGGLAAIEVAGVTKLGVIHEPDRANSEPSFSADVISIASFYTADESGSTRDPYLEINHGAAEEGGNSSRMLLLGVGL